MAGWTGSLTGACRHQCKIAPIVCRQLFCNFGGKETPSLLVQSTFIAAWNMWKCFEVTSCRTLDSWGPWKIWVPGKRSAAIAPTMPGTPLEIPNLPRESWFFGESINPPVSDTRFFSQKVLELMARFWRGNSWCLWCLSLTERCWEHFPTFITLKMSNPFLDFFSKIGFWSCSCSPPVFFSTLQQFFPKNFWHPTQRADSRRKILRCREVGSPEDVSFHGVIDMSYLVTVPTTYSQKTRILTKNWCFKNEHHLNPFLWNNGSFFWGGHMNFKVQTTLNSPSSFNFLVCNKAGRYIIGQFRWWGGWSYLPGHVTACFGGFSTASCCINSRVFMGLFMSKIDLLSWS